jgi:phage pi2 protein 07
MNIILFGSLTRPGSFILKHTQLAVRHVSTPKSKVVETKPNEEEADRFGVDKKYAALDRDASRKSVTKISKAVIMKPPATVKSRMTSKNQGPVHNPDKFGNLTNEANTMYLFSKISF